MSKRACIKDDDQRPSQRLRRLGPDLDLRHSLDTLPIELFQMVYNQLDRTSRENLRSVCQSICNNIELSGYKHITISISHWNQEKIKFILANPVWLAHIESLTLKSHILDIPPNVHVNQLIQVKAGKETGLSSSASQDILLTQPSIIEYAKAVAEQRLLISDKTFFKDLSDLLKQCQRLRTIKHNCLLHPKDFECHMRKMFPRMIPDQCLPARWVKISNISSTIASDLLMDTTRVATKSRPRAESVDTLILRNVHLDTKKRNQGVQAHRLSRHIASFSSSLTELNLAFGCYVYARRFVYERAIWHLLGRSTRFPALKKLSLDCVLMRGNGMNENMDRFLESNRSTLVEVHLGEWYFEDNLLHPDGWFLVLRAFAEHANLKKFSPGEYQRVGKHTNEMDWCSEDDFNRACKVPALGTGRAYHITRDLLYQRLICGDTRPFTSSTLDYYKRVWDDVDWSKVDFDMMKTLEDMVLGKFRRTLALWRRPRTNE